MSARPFRLALRVEGTEWRAYLARVDTMDEAILLGSIAFGLIEKDEEVKADFMALMQKAVARAVLDVTGSKIESWDKPKGAPFWEKK